MVKTAVPKTNISGTATNCTIEASSGSSFKGYDLVQIFVKQVRAAAPICVYTVNKELSASASSGGQIQL